MSGVLNNVGNSDLNSKFVNVSIILISTTRILNIKNNSIVTITRISNYK